MSGRAISATAVMWNFVLAHPFHSGSRATGVGDALVIVSVRRQAYDSGMAYDEVLADRVREKLRSSPGVAEKRMFGGIAFLTDGNMTVGVRGDELIVRISPNDTDAALAEPGVRIFDITGKPMRGWILVAGEQLDSDDLDRWIVLAKTFVASLPPK